MTTFWNPEATLGVKLEDMLHLEKSTPSCYGSRNEEGDQRDETRARKQSKEGRPIEKCKPS
ncbi:hypothetical protein LR48_Vigan07g153800 [Vigna angularis]|uniref:Uncharacterized protein n=1 Tax=Phaseolus angularis TaxID=3914 RepID=A0A0L9UZ51_PHAAN|nr:hypothetical protein LR48_Vigan07g153800 [Vigna angularis]